MTIKQALKTLKTYNKWRRGAEIKIDSPSNIGTAIDVLIEYAEEKMKIN